MKRRITVSLLIVLMFAGVSFGQGLIRPKTADDALGTATYPFGTIYASGITTTSKTYTVSAGTVYVPSNLVVTGTILATSTVSSASALLSYDYTAVASTNKSTQLYIMQGGTNNMDGTTQTNTFGVTYIAAPYVAFVTLTGVNTSVVVIATNAFTTAGTAQNGTWISYGRVK